ncbi:TetR/AcrR family transcriptional regulator [Saccharopolyspora phatthalungensis]|uniref:AcrR family transcriptional regulator n=1 Tax=Saccharopolyspora phatthalungensis TaxID=664693 RepID=A0A840QCI2_9PSEU|nr:TetR/AcrR family transcriptional regulator [Saccharopolyspora phatthalungensis]MBB5158444.1 AcrR family transcriptional regulator [Saccharopolyspora phatthalungensis]
MAGGRYHHGDLRAALLDSATTALRTRGVDALSLRELARDIGVSHAAPRRHFKDKRALLNALALRGFERLSAELEAAAATEGPFRRRLAAMARAYVHFAVHDAELLELMFVRKHAPDASEELVAGGHQLGASMFAVIADGQRGGDVHAGDPEGIGLAMFAGLHGFASLAVGGMLPDGSVDAALDLLLDELHHGLAPRAINVSR